MPETKGFLNGYAPTFTADVEISTGRALLSFDYYLDPERSAAQAAADLEVRPCGAGRVSAFFYFQAQLTCL